MRTKSFDSLAADFASQLWLAPNKLFMIVRALVETY
jgi:hypothetical protein